MPRHHREDAAQVHAMNPLRALLAAVIDYAGLFPPAGLDMATAVRNFGEYLSSDDGWMLGRFVVPVARLDEFRAAHERLERGGPAWHLSALLGADIQADLRVIAECNRRAHGHVVIDAIEGRLDNDTAMREAAAAGDSLAVFAELACDDQIEARMDAAKRAGVHAKIRTGGVTPNAFPPAAMVVRFIRACADRGVRFKCTAGLHHPLTGEYRLTYEPTSQVSAMFGFLNVLLTSAAIANGASDREAIAMLSEFRAAAVSATDDAVRWTSSQFDVATLERVRDNLVVSFGSCSFTEPRDGLRELTLLVVG